MKRTLATFAGALLASTIMAAPVIAQDKSGDQGTNSGQSSDELLLKKNQPGATGGTKGEVQGQTEMKPGQTETKGTAQTESQGSAKTQMGQGETATKPKVQTGQTETEGTAKTQTGQTEVKPGQSGTEGQTQTGQTETKPSNETTGSINITTEQQTEVKQLITTTKVEPADIDFDIRVGVKLQKKVKLYPLPARVVEIVPAYKSYEYFLLPDGRIVIVEPDTLEIVYILS
jgi:hypothetical protein